MDSAILCKWELTPLHTTPIAITIVNRLGRMLYINQKFEELFGYTPDELIGCPVEELIPHRLRNTHVHHRQNYHHNLHIRPMGLGMELSGLRKDGREFPIEAGLSYFEQAGEQFVFVTIVDISLRKQAEQALRRSEDRYRQLAECAPYAILICQQNRILYTNPACVELFAAQSVDQLACCTAPSLFANSPNAAEVPPIDQLLRVPESTTAFEEKIIRLDGTTVDVEVVATPFDTEYGIATLFIMTDITERKEAAALLERRVEERTRELEQRQLVSEGLSHVLNLLNSNHSVAEVLNHIAQQAMNLLDAESCALFEFQEQQSQFVVPIAQGGLAHALPQKDFPLNQSNVAGYVTLTNQLLCIGDLNQPLPPAQSMLEDRRRLLCSMGYQAVLGMPLPGKGEPSGAMVLYFNSVRQFHRDELELVKILSSQAVVALDNEKLRIQSQQAAVDAERSRISRDLHDAVTQTLFAASIIAEALPVIWRQNAEAGEERLAQLRALTKSALAEMRTLLLELRPARLLEMALADSLQQLSEAFTGRVGVPIIFHREGDAVLSPPVKVALYRIAQEALNNITKHARATQVQIELRGSDKVIELIIQDDGQGFLIDQIQPQSLGLGIMRERAESIGAYFEITSQPNRGTTIVVRKFCEEMDRVGEDT